MGYVVAFAVAVFLGGVAYVAGLSVLTYRKVKALSARVAEANARISDAAAALETLAGPDR